MNNWKKIITLAGMILLLAACGNDDTNTDETEVSSTSAVESSEVVMSSETGSTEANTNITNENFLQIIDIIRSNGFEISEPTVGDNDVKGAKDNVYFDINGEHFLIFQVFEMEPGDENLKLAEDTGMVILEFDGEEGEVPADMVIENYIFFLPEGHPDHDAVFAALEEEFQPK